MDDNPFASPQSTEAPPQPKRRKRSSLRFWPPVMVLAGMALIVVSGLLTAIPSATLEPPGKLVRNAAGATASLGLLLVIAGGLGFVAILIYGIGSGCVQLLRRRK